MAFSRRARLACRGAIRGSCDDRDGTGAFLIPLQQTSGLHKLARNQNEPIGHAREGTRMRRFLAVSVAILGLAVALSDARAEAIKIKFSHVVAEATPKGQAALLFKKL